MLLTILTDTDIDAIFSCSSNGTGLSSIIKLLGFVYNILLVSIPIIVVLFAIIELIKAISHSKEDYIKKAYSKLIKKIIIAFLVFLIMIFIKVIIEFLDENILESTNAKACIELFLGE